MALLTMRAALAADPGAAQTALDRGDYRAAETIYRELLRRGESPELLNNLGLALHLQGRSSESAATLRRALKLREMPAALALLAADYCRLRQTQQAAALLRRLHSNRQDPNILRLLAPCYLDTGEPVDAVQVYEELVQRGVEPADEYMVGLARANFRASREFLTRLEKAPRNQVYMQAIRGARQLGSPDARGAFPAAFQNASYLRAGMPVDELAKLLPSHGRDAALLYVLGVVYAEQAMQTVLHCRRQYPGSAPVRRLEAEILVSQGRDQEALAEYAALLRDGIAAAGLHHDIAMLYRQRGEWDKALEEFKAENKAAPDDERALVGISECLLRLERFDALSQHLKPVLAANDAPEWALLDAATAAQQAAKSEQAIGYLKRLAAQNPANSSAHYRLSKLYAAMARPEQARREMSIFRTLRSYE